MVCCIHAHINALPTRHDAAQDDVIRPRDTRARLIRELRLLKNKSISKPWKKHGNIPL